MQITGLEAIVFDDIEQLKSRYNSCNKNYYDSFISLINEKIKTLERLRTGYLNLSQIVKTEEQKKILIDGIQELFSDYSDLLNLLQTITDLKEPSSDQLKQLTDITDSLVEITAVFRYFIRCQLTKQIPVY